MEVSGTIKRDVRIRLGVTVSRISRVWARLGINEVNPETFTLVSSIGLPLPEYRVTPRLRNDLYCVEWDVKPECTSVPYRVTHVHLENGRENGTYARACVNSWRSAAADCGLCTDDVDG